MNKENEDKKACPKCNAWMSAYTTYFFGPIYYDCPFCGYSTRPKWKSG